MATAIISSLHVELLQAVSMRDEAISLERQHLFYLQNGIPIPPAAPAAKGTFVSASSNRDRDVSPHSNFHCYI